jgi:hypothetical protein
MSQPLVVLVAAVSLSVLGGCTRSAEADTASEVPGRKAEVTPAIEKKAAALLQEHGGEALGSEYPFELEGRRYVGRLEEHDNPAGEPDRPRGKHRGVTVYTAK